MRPRRFSCSFYLSVFFFRRLLDLLFRAWFALWRGRVHYLGTASLPLIISTFVWLISSRFLTFSFCRAKLTAGVSRASRLTKMSAQHLSREVALFYGVILRFTSRECWKIFTDVCVYWRIGNRLSFVTPGVLAVDEKRYFLNRFSSWLHSLRNSVFAIVEYQAYIYRYIYRARFGNFLFLIFTETGQSDFVLIESNILTKFKKTQQDLKSHSQSETLQCNY